MFSIAICATCTTGDDLDDEVTAYKKGDYKTELKLLQKEADKGNACLLYTSDAADDLLCVDLGGRRIIKKNKQIN